MVLKLISSRFPVNSHLQQHYGEVLYEWVLVLMHMMWPTQSHTVHWSTGGNVLTNTATNQQQKTRTVKH